MSSAGDAVRIDSGRPDAGTRAAIGRLAEDIEQTDGAPPLSDQTRSRLDSPDATHLLARAGHRLVGYAQVADGVAEVAAANEGLEPLLDAVTAAGSPLIWSHGRHSRLIGALERRGRERGRELHQLRRRLDAAALPPDPSVPADVTVRPFRPGRDDAAWLALNAAAFARHPEQGRWTQRDLDARLAEPWFDAAGFLLAQRADQLVAFHWTKIHPDGAGEVYVLAVSPDAQGTGLGSALLVRGLRYLAGRGCPYVLLYVDGDNPTALHLYERDGFTRHDLDVQWR